MMTYTTTVAQSSIQRTSIQQTSSQGSSVRQTSIQTDSNQKVVKLPPDSANVRNLIF